MGRSVKIASSVLLLIFAYAMLMLLAFVGDPAEGGEVIQRAFVIAVLIASFVPGVLGARLLLKTVMMARPISKIGLLVTGVGAAGASATVFILDMLHRGMFGDAPLLFLPLLAYLGIALVSLALHKTKSV